MDKNNYIKLIHNTKTFDELESLKQGFLKECDIQHKHIAVANILGSIDNFGDAKMMFESLVPSILNKKEGKTLINNYTKTIK